MIFTTIHVKNIVFLKKHWRKEIKKEKKRERDSERLWKKERGQEREIVEKENERAKEKESAVTGRTKYQGLR